jgi:hypothetical protein
MYGTIKRGFEYPFDSFSDFFFKLGVTLAWALPIYLVLSVIGGLFIWVVQKKRES